ncbi:MAG: DUF6472 family protein [Lachnospiraceae bacterium]|jgi:hypothetical protein
MNCCDYCAYLMYDEEYCEYYCDADIDEDDYARMMNNRHSGACPYFRNGDEYRVVRHQI